MPLDAGDGGSTLAIVTTVLIDLSICAIVALKGKFSAAVIGMFIPPVAWVGAIRLAAPGSWWAKRRYKPGSGKLVKATTRKAKHDRRVRKCAGPDRWARPRCRARVRPAPADPRSNFAPAYTIAFRGRPAIERRPR